MRLLRGKTRLTLREFLSPGIPWLNRSSETISQRKLVEVIEDCSNSSALLFAEVNLQQSSPS